MLRDRDFAGEAGLDWLEQSSLLLLSRVLEDRIAGRAALVSSFGAESAVLLHLASRVDPAVPVLFVDTRMMFQETLDYQRALSAELGLSDVRTVSADATELRREDVFGRLHLKDADACCAMRKVRPLERALEGFDAWINGRKRHQSDDRAAIRPIEEDGEGRLRINPLLAWERADLEAYYVRHGLPRHPLTGHGFTSIGCAPCTVPPAAGADPRSGRWAGSDKTECGIFVSGGRIVRRRDEDLRRSA